MVATSHIPLSQTGGIAKKNSNICVLQPLIPSTKQSQISEFHINSKYQFFWYTFRGVNYNVFSKIKIHKVLHFTSVYLFLHSVL